MEIIIGRASGVGMPFDGMKQPHNLISPHKSKITTQVVRKSLIIVHLLHNSLRDICSGCRCSSNNKFIKCQTLPIKFSLSTQCAVYGADWYELRNIVTLEIYCLFLPKKMTNRASAIKLRAEQSLPCSVWSKKSAGKYANDFA